jgi:hypothetical protein
MYIRKLSRGIDCAMISESHLLHEHNDATVSVDECKLFSHDRNGGKVCDVAVCVRRSAYVCGRMANSKPSTSRQIRAILG